MNDYQKRRFSEDIVKTMFNTVSDKKIGIWGFAFKKDTNDTRESAAIYVCRDLLRERARLCIHDPRVPEKQIRQELMSACTDMSGHLTEKDRWLVENNVSVAKNCYEAADDAHAIAVLTEWDEFKEIDFQQIHASMHRPSFLFDGRNLLDQETMDGLGFEMHAIGKSHNRNNSPSS